MRFTAAPVVAGRHNDVTVLITLTSGQRSAAFIDRSRHELGGVVVMNRDRLLKRNCVVEQWLVM